ncbi:MAG: hypothetical protein ACYTFE_04015, partial [Planctomycetota bacterium]|jgi:hypothetical protein
MGDHVNRYLAKGKSATIFYDPYPKGFGDFRDANIMLVNLKSQYKPFTIAMPYGCRVNPYMAEGALPHIFQTWGNTSALGHIVNYWHYRRTDNTLEQVYLQGMTNADNPVDELVSLAWSWIANPRLWMKGESRKWSYDIRYDHAQRAYIIPREGQGPCELEFTLEEDLDIGEFGAAMWIVNPCFIVKDWGSSGVEFRVDDKNIEVGKNFRIGYEKTQTGTNLILWLKVKSDKMMSFTIKPKN